MSRTLHFGGASLVVSNFQAIHTKNRNLFFCPTSEKNVRRASWTCRIKFSQKTRIDPSHESWVTVKKYIYLNIKKERNIPSFEQHSCPICYAFKHRWTLQRTIGNSAFLKRKKREQGDTTNEKKKERKKQPYKQQRQTKNCKKVINMNKKHPKRCRSQVIFQSKCQHFHLS